VRETRAQTFDFYRDIVQQLKTWQARPPKLRGAVEDEVLEAPSAEPPRFEESDVPEVGEATDPQTISHSLTACAAVMPAR
jgi:hypothetical protein